MPKGFHNNHKGPIGGNSTSFKKGMIPWNKKDKIFLICKICGKKFCVVSSVINRKGRGQYCSKKCKNKSQEKKVRRVCLVCGKEFFIINYRFKKIKNGGKYCSVTCRKRNRVFKETSIELKIKKELNSRDIKYFKNYYLEDIVNVDFFLPKYNLVIQCDGDYWHNKLEVKERDERQDKVLIENGYKVYRFWEHEINESVEKCINRIKEL
jgi:very-short-patch-repair endonuclease